MQNAAEIVVQVFALVVWGVRNGFAMNPPPRLPRRACTEALTFGTVLKDGIWGYVWTPLRIQGRCRARSATALISFHTVSVASV